MRDGQAPAAAEELVAQRALAVGRLEETAALQLGHDVLHDLEAHHMNPWALGGQTVTDALTLECPRHHKYIHDHGIRVTGTGKNPIYTSADGRLITATQPHAPPG